MCRFKEVNTRLRKLLAEERRSLQQVRQNYQNEINSRTELELVLRDCVEEVRREAERRYAQSALSSLSLSKCSPLRITR
jgi:FKBP-type peptidyl-prolyl cis-trans isomerase (trigger factor)